MAGRGTDILFGWQTPDVIMAEDILFQKSGPEPAESIRAKEAGCAKKQSAKSLR